MDYDYYLTSYFAHEEKLNQLVEIISIPLSKNKWSQYYKVELSQNDNRFKFWKRHYNDYTKSKPIPFVQYGNISDECVYGDKLYLYHEMYDYYLIFLIPLIKTDIYWHKTITNPSMHNYKFNLYHPYDYTYLIEEALDNKSYLRYISKIKSDFIIVEKNEFLDCIEQMIKFRYYLCKNDKKWKVYPYPQFGNYYTLFWNKKTRIITEQEIWDTFDISYGVTDIKMFVDKIVQDHIFKELDSQYELQKQYNQFIASDDLEGFIKCQINNIDFTYHTIINGNFYTKKISIRDIILMILNKYYITKINSIEIISLKVDNILKFLNKEDKL